MPSCHAVHSHVVVLYLCAVVDLRTSCASGYAAQGDFENMVKYSTANGYKPDYLYLMQVSLTLSLRSSLHG